MRSDAAWRNLWPLVAAAGALLVYDAPLLLMQGVALGMDGIRQYYPAEHALATALAHGTLPFWTPDLQTGFPLFAEAQPGALYPINLLAFGLLPTPVAHNAILILHHFLGLLFVFWWGRTLDLSRVAAALMAFVFCQTTDLRGADVLLIETIVWIPLLLGLTERFVRRGAASAAWWAAPVFAVQWVGGFPQIALYTLLATQLYLVVRLLGEEWSWARRVRMLVAWSGAALLGMSFAAPQLLPQYELSRFSIRAGGIKGSLSGEKSLVPPALITMVLPSWRGFFGPAGLGKSIYFGVLPCLLGLFAVVRRPRRPWFLALLVVVLTATLFAFGRFNPLFPVMRRLPGFAYFRYPSRFLIFSQFGLITFFGLGWDVLSVRAGQLAAGPPTRGRDALYRLLQGAVALLALNALVAHPLLRRLKPYLLDAAERYTRRYILTDPYHMQPLTYYQEKIETLYRSVLGAVSLQHTDVWLPLAIALSGWLVVRWSGGAWRQAFLGLLVVIDVQTFAGVRHSVESRSWLREPPTLALVRREASAEPCRLFWVVHPRLVTFQRENLLLLPANYNLLFGVASTGVYAPLGFHTYFRLMRRLGTVDLGFGYRPVTLDHVAEDRALLDFLNACYVLSIEPIPGFTELGQVDGVRVYRNAQALPRAFAVDRVEIVGSVDAAIDWMRAHPERLHDTAVLEQGLPHPLDGGAATGTAVRVTEYRATRASLQVSAPGAVLVVMTDADYPGWRATIDGTPAPIYRTQAMFRGVRIPAGEHRVTFTYSPAIFWRGLALGGLGVAVWAAWGGIAARERRRRAA